MNPPFEISIVYTYIDAVNNEALKASQKQAMKTSANQKKQPESAHEIRWRDFGELQQSIQSIHKFAPWVSKLFVVSPNKEPSWFSLINEVKASKIKHTWILESTLTGNPEPMFNSHVAESCLHLIPDLSENFVYFCDDMFLGKPIAYTEWFSPTGKPRLHVNYGTKTATNKSTQTLIVHNAYVQDPKKYIKAWQGALATADQLLRIHFKSQKNLVSNRQYNPMLYHCCAPVTKQGFLDVYNVPLMKNVLDQTRRSLFRKSTDVHTVFLVSAYLFRMNKAECYGCPCVHDSNTSVNDHKTLVQSTRHYGELSALEKSIKFLWLKKTSFYCLNDACSLTHDRSKEIKKLLETKLPHHF